jgi:methylated-DNA-[protein]-cysteine S-methyltransferase
MEYYSGYYKSPIGFLEIKATDEGIFSVIFTDEMTSEQSENTYIRQCIEQLDEYFRGLRSTFTVALSPNGTEFQRKVWQHVMSIPYGRTVTYSDIAIRLGNDHASRAVGMANAKNQIAILIPCHRVIGKNKDLTGYAWGTWRKEWLIQHEMRNNLDYCI